MRGRLRIFRQICLDMPINAEMLTYIPISTERAEMEGYLDDGFVRMVFDTYLWYYPKVGYHPPWIGYFALFEGKVVGVGGFKGPAKKNQVEISYATVPEYEGQGVSSQTCKYLTGLALAYDSSLRITARTLMTESASTSILRKNGYVYIGIVDDPDDGDVWEWVYKGEG